MAASSFMFGQGSSDNSTWKTEVNAYRQKGAQRRKELLQDTRLYAEGSEKPVWARQGSFDPLRQRYTDAAKEEQFAASIAAKHGTQPAISNETPAWFLGRRAAPVRPSQLAFDQRPIRELPAHVKELQEGGKGNKRRHVAGIMRTLWEPESRREKAVPHEVTTTTDDFVQGQTAADPPVVRWPRRMHHHHRATPHMIAAENPDWIVGAVGTGGGGGGASASGATAAAAAAASNTNCGVRSSAFSSADLHWKCGHNETAQERHGPRWDVASTQEFKVQCLSQLQSTDAPGWMSDNAARRQTARAAEAAEEAAAATARGPSTRPSAETILAGLRPPPDPHAGRDPARARMHAGARTRPRHSVVAKPDPAAKPVRLKSKFTTDYGQISDSTVSGDAPAFFVDANRRICPNNVRELPTDSAGTFRAHRGRRLLQEVLDKAAIDFQDEPAARQQHLFADHFKPRYRGRGKRASDMHFEGDVSDGAYNIITNSDRDLAQEAAARRAAHARVRGPPRTYRQRDRQRDASPSPVKAAGAALVGSSAQERAVMEKLAKDRADTENAEFGLLAETSERFKSMREAFMSIDRDGDGRVGWKELAAMCRRWNLPKEQVQSTIAKCDEDGDGLVDFAEFSSKFGRSGYTEARAF